MQVHKIRLLDNAYDLEIADELLKRFIDAKIAFFKDRLKKSDSKDSSEIKQLEKAITDLLAEKRSLDLFMEQFDGEHVEMEIGATIVMSVNPV